MTKQPGKFHITIWTYPIVRFFIVLSTNGIHQGVRSYSVKEVAVGTTPGSRYPFSFPINGFVLVQPNCFCTAFRTFLFYGWHHQYLVVCSIAPTSLVGLKILTKRWILNLSIYCKNTLWWTYGLKESILICHFIWRSNFEPLFFILEKQKDWKRWNQWIGGERWSSCCWNYR